MAHKKLHGAKYFANRLSKLEQERQSFIAHYKDLSEFIQPRRGRFFLTDHNKGEPVHQAIINSHATRAHRTARSGLFAGVMSPTRPWFAYGTPDDPDLMEFEPVKIWLHQVEMRILTMFNRSNLYSQAPVMLGDLLLFATGCMTHVSDFEKVARFQTHTAGSYMIAQDARGVVTTLVRKFQMTTAQMVEEFGPDKVSTGVKDQWDNGTYDSWHDVVHFIEPNPDADPTRAGNRFKPFRSVKYQPSELDKIVKGKFLSESGFDRFPAYVPRWDLTGEDIYGTDGPAMTSLGDVKQLQMQERRKAQGIDKQVNPPLKGPASVRNVPVSSLPGGLTIYDTGSGSEKLEPLYTVAPNIQDMVADIEKTERRIDSSFFVDLFFAITNMEGIQPKNQLELLQRNEERLLQLGPPLERVHGEFLEGLVDRSFDQMFERDLLPPPPKELEDKNIEPQFISSLAIAQRSVATGSIERLIGFVGGLKEVGYEASLDKVDADEAVEAYGDLIRVPPKLIKSDAVVAEERQAREEERQAQVEAQLAQQSAGSLKDEAAGVKDLSEIGGVGG